MTTHIDINVDVGEGINNEAEIMPFISSCNIACGGHAGDLKTMRHVVKLAKEYSVKIGAHPSFPDKEHFGRKPMEMPCVTLYTSIKNQIKDLVSVLEEAHLPLHHVKPHGALYNMAAVDENIAQIIIEVMKGLMLRAKLYVPYNSVISKLAIAQGIPILYEAFADRNYTEDLKLVPRTASHAVIENEEALFNHVNTMLMSQKVRTVSGALKEIKADTFCIHGDNPNAVYLITSLTKRLEENGIKVT